jgi:hypothetical protein
VHKVILGSSQKVFYILPKCIVHTILKKNCYDMTSIQSLDNTIIKELVQ